MESVIIKTPLGFTEVKGDADGISKIHVLSVELSTIIPNDLIEAVNQLEEYFIGKRTEFTFKLNPKGTEFQKKVWQELLKIPYGKTCSYLELSKKNRRCESNSSSSIGKW